MTKRGPPNADVAKLRDSSKSDNDEFTACQHHLVPAADVRSAVEGALKASCVPSSWCCADCGDREDLYLCVGCGRVSCGSKANGHAQRHYEAATAPRAPSTKKARRGKGDGSSLALLHSLAVSLTEPQVHCYECDDWVIVDDDTATTRGTGTDGRLSCAALVLAAVKGQLAGTHAGADNPRQASSVAGAALTNPVSAAPAADSSIALATAAPVPAAQPAVAMVADAKATSKARKGGAPLIPGRTGMVK